MAYGYFVVLRGLRDRAPRLQRLGAHCVLLLRPQKDSGVHLHLAPSATGGCVHEQHLLSVHIHGLDLLPGICF